MKQLSHCEGVDIIMSTAKSPEETEETEVATSGPCFGQRHLLSLMVSWLICGIFCMRDILGVAIVAMVNNTAVNSPSRNTTVSSDCPVEFSNKSSSHVSSDGPFLWSRPVQGLILGSLFWGYIVLQLPGGAVSQRFGAKWVLGTSTLANIILTVLSPLAASTSPYMLIAFRVVEGLFQGVTFSASQAMLSRWVPPKEATFLNTFAFSGSTIGAIMGLVIAGLLSRSSWGWPSSFYVSAGIGVATFLPWVFFVTNSPEQNRWIKPEELAHISRYIGTGTQELSNRHGVPWFRILSDMAVWAVVAGNFCTVWIYNIVISCLPQFLSDVQHTEISRNGTLVAMPWIVNFIASVFFAYLSDALVSKSYLRSIVARKIFMIGGNVGASVCLCGVVLTACNESGTITLFVVLMGFIGAAYVPLYGNVAELSPEFSGTIMGLVIGIGAIPGFLAPIVTDHIALNGTRKQWNQVFFIATGIDLFGAVFYAIFASSKRREWNVLRQNLDK